MYVLDSIPRVPPAARLPGTVLRLSSPGHIRANVRRARMGKARGFSHCINIRSQLTRSSEAGHIVVLMGFNETVCVVRERILPSQVADWPLGCEQLTSQATAPNELI